MNFKRLRVSTALIIPVLALAGLSKSAFSQSRYDFLKAGDDAFMSGKYYTASVYYKKVLEMHADSSVKAFPYNNPSPMAEPRYLRDYYEVQFKLAECFRLYKDFVPAELEYEKVVVNAVKDFPLSRLWYGVSLRANAKYPEALAQLRRFKAEYQGDPNYTQIAAYEIKCCEFAIKAIEKPTYTYIEKLKEPINSEGSNYAAALADSTTDYSIWYTSSRPKSEKDAVKGFSNDLYYTLGEDLNMDGPHAGTIPLKKGWQQGTPTLTADKKVMYFTRWKEGKKPLYVIYHVKKDDADRWGEPQKVKGDVNLEASKNAHPFITEDGRRLYFASDRPGGMGGMDIYYTDLDTAGTPGPVQNLGLSVNTDKDEMSPYYHEGYKALFFASNGRVGMGGFDLFKVKGEPGNWAEPENLGYPINSSEDDAYLIWFKSDSTRGYISSDRNSFCCYELFYIEEINGIARGCVYDAETKKPIDSALVYVMDSVTGKILDSVYTNKEGCYTFALKKNQNFRLLATHPHYLRDFKFFNSKDLTRGETRPVDPFYLNPLEIGKRFVIPNILYDFDSDKLRPESLPTLDKLVKFLDENRNVKLELSSHCDSVGSDAYNMKLSQRRAESAVKYLIENGVDQELIVAKGYGESVPIAPNSNPDGTDNPEGRQLNRRTEFKVLEIKERRKLGTR